MANISTTGGFRVLDLPAELREQIFIEAVRSERVIAPRVSIPRDAYVLRLPALVAVNRQLRQECLPLYFGENEFQFNLKDVLETPFQQDLQYEKKLLTFGAWCEAVGLERFKWIRRFAIVTSSALNAPLVSVGWNGRGEVKAEVWSFWRGYRSRIPRGGVMNAPEFLIDVVRQAVGKPEVRKLLPAHVVLFCRYIQGCGTEVLLSS